MSGRAEIAKGWMAKAQSDLAAAQAVVNGPGPYDTACFHCQQAVEKFMKSFLAHHGREFPFTHDLDEFANLCDQILPSPKLSQPEVIALTDYAVRLRYDNSFWPSKQDASGALAVAVRVRDTILIAIN